VLRLLPGAPGVHGDQHVTQSRLSEQSVRYEGRGEGGGGKVKE
jgi:hypothetical protein